MDEIAFTAFIQPPPEKGMACFKPSDDYLDAIRDFARSNKLKPGSKVRITLQPFDDYASVAAFNLFHLLRDRLAEAMAGGPKTPVSRADKELIKRSLKHDFGAKELLYEDPLSGQREYEMKSTKAYKRAEMLRLLQGTLGRCDESGADLSDIDADIKEICAMLTKVADEDKTDV